MPAFDARTVLLDLVAAEPCSFAVRTVANADALAAAAASGEKIAGIGTGRYFCTSSAVSVGEASEGPSLSSLRFRAFAASFEVLLSPPVVVGDGMVNSVAEAIGASGDLSSEAFSPSLLLLAVPLAFAGGT